MTADLNRIHGTVLDCRGNPVSDAILSMVASSAVLPELAIVADASGVFRMALPSGRYAIEAQSTELRSTARVTFDVSGPMDLQVRFATEKGEVRADDESA